MTPTKILIAALLACAFAPALANEAGLEAGEQAARTERTERRIVTRTGDGVHVELGNLAELRALDGLGSLGGATVVHMHGAKLVKNAPYSAEMVSERIQTLGDGNQIVNKSSTMSYRDSAGRTRSEVRNAEGEVRSVTIVDPVEGARYFLRPRDKTAIKISAPNATVIAAREHARVAAREARVAAAEARVAGSEARLAARAAAAQAHARIDELHKEGKLAEGAHERVIIKQVERSGEHRDVQIRIAQSASPAIAARVAPMIAGAMDEHKWAAKATFKDLGTREFNGLKAQGSSRSYEIPAGEIGNRNAIVVSTETWVSPELQAVVYQKRSDPRAGDAVLRLESLRREEPAAALFAVPSDYTVKDPVAMAKSRIEKKSQ
ncbi:hypothetical protein [Telluria aromaticivorans]|uniref:Uncharacterized protein n=1 Tax=Telluria aromaticivorans TaxID=2725995 RepID=A0A7Y2K1E2_9BURK|nr:hypothetical protein [Telluria aromaticivorans]NNG24786.1 hypothetical protein [Telluria aromaticivorans]